MPGDLSAAKSDEKLQAAVKKLPAEEQQLLVAYMVRAAMAQGFNSPLPPVATLGDAISAQRNWAAEVKAREAEQKALAAKVQAERAAARKQMDDTLTVAVTGKRFVPSDIESRRFQDAIAMSIAFQNKSARDLRGVKGKLSFKDIFGDSIRDAALSLDEPIPAGQAITWQGTLDYNQFRAADTKLVQTPLEKLKTEWLPDTYLFADGTSMKMPEGAAD